MSQPRARDFSDIVQQFDEGTVHSDLSDAVQRVVRATTDIAFMTQGKAKGSIVLKLNFEARANATVSVDCDMTIKEPKMKRQPTSFFATKDNNLSLDNPRQGKLALRDVLPKREAATEPPNDDKKEVH